MFSGQAACAAMGIGASIVLWASTAGQAYGASPWSRQGGTGLVAWDRGGSCESRPRHDRGRRDDHDDEDASCPLVLRSQVELGGKHVNVEVTIWREDRKVHTRVRLTPCGKGKLPDIDSISIALRTGGSHWRPALCEVRSCDREIVFEAHDGPNWRKGRSVSVDLRVATDCDRDRVRWLGESLN